jgi:VanZ family protein
MPHVKLWYALGIVLTLGVVVSSLVPARDLPRLYISDKTEHIIAYSGLALWFGGLLKPQRYGLLGFLLLLLGGGIEIAQGLMGMGRESDIRDFAADTVGVALGLGLCLLGLRYWVAGFEWLLRRF